MLEIFKAALIVDAKEDAYIVDTPLTAGTSEVVAALKVHKAPKSAKSSLGDRNILSEGDIAYANLRKYKGYVQIVELKEVLK